MEPLPHYVLACVEWRTVTLTVNGQPYSYRVCEREDWTRRVDTIPAPPETLP